jgi:predicted RNA binding protein YcfA (HicA-like mRNA interferase family)
MSDIVAMNGKQFIRRARKWANVAGVAFRFDASRGKGGHQTVYVGSDRLTVVKTGEIGTGLLASMLKDLGIPPKEF